MTAHPDRHPAGRWILAVLVVLLVLGHVCDLSVFAHVDAHHQVDGDADEELSSCDAMPSASSAGHARACPMPAVAVALPVIDETALRPVGPVVEGRAPLVGRPPLFLLHAALLI